MAIDVEAAESPTEAGSRDEAPMACGGGGAEDEAAAPEEAKHDFAG